MVTSLDRPGLVRLLDAGGQIVDVLPEAEYAESHIPGAINIPLRQLSTKTVEILSRKHPVAVY